jgi:predicted esterase
MSKRFYYAAIILTILGTVTGIVQAIRYAQLGGQTITLDGFLRWYLILSTVAFAGGVVVSLYLYQKRYRFSFWSAIASLAASLLQFTIIYLLLSGHPEYNNFYPLAITATTLAMVIFFLSLLASQAKERIMLRCAGIVGLVSSLMTAYAVYVAMDLSDPQNALTSITVYTWAGFFAAAIPLLYCANFIEELGTAKSARSSPGSWVVVDMVVLVIALLAIPLSVIGSTTWLTQSYWVIKWNDEALERSASLAAPFEAREFLSEKGDKLLYRIFIPDNYDSTKQYPLVVGLHHGGSHGQDNVRQIDGTQPVQALYQLRSTYPAILFVPQCPQGMAFGAPAGSVTLIDSIVFEAIAEIEKAYNVDSKRRYVTGISGGGYGSWHFLKARPKMFAAAVPICGGGDPANAASFSDVAIWAFHGENDRLVPVEYSRSMIKALQQAGGSPKYTEFPGAGHNIWEGYVSQTPGLFEWMFAQRRE